MFRKEKALTPMQRMEISRQWAEDDMYWTTTRCK